MTVNELEEIALPEYSFNEEALHRHLQMYNCHVPQGHSQLSAPIMVYTFPPNQPPTPPPAYTPNSVEQEHTSPDTQQQQGVWFQACTEVLLSALMPYLQNTYYTYYTTTYTEYTVTFYYRTNNNSLQQCE